MKADSLVLTLLTKQPLVEFWKAERLYDILDRWRFRPTKFNDVEPVRNAWEDRDQFMEQFAMNCRESFGTLIVEWKKPKFNLMVIWSCGPLAKHHCLSFFNARYQDLGGSKVPYLLELADQLFDELDFHYGFACMDAEYHATNINLDVQIDERIVQPKQVVGMEWPDCLPGLYWCNYFSNEYLAQGFGKCISKTGNCTKLCNGTRLLRSDSPLDWDSGDSKSLTQQFIDCLGPEWFFTKEGGMATRRLQADKSLFDRVRKE